MTQKEWLQRHDRQVAEHVRQIAAHDRQIKAIQALIQEGVRLMIQTRKELRVVVALNKKNMEKLDRLIQSLERGTNGHAKSKIDIQ